MDWWVADLMRDDPVRLLSWVVWVIGSIVLHELAHGWAAIRQGDNTPIETGHMTWNPLVHMGGMSLIVFALVGIAWGLMPVNPSRFRDRYGDAYVAFAGPAMNLGLAVICIVLAALWGGYAQSVPNPLWANVIVFLQTGAFLNLVLAFFNLLPVPPLDGSRILADFSYPYRELISQPQAPLIGLVIMVLLFSQFGGWIFTPAAVASRASISWLRDAMPGTEVAVGRMKAVEFRQYLLDESDALRDN